MKTFSPLKSPGFLMLFAGFAFVVGAALCPVAIPAVNKAEAFPTKAATVAGAEFLHVPDKLPGKNFVVAKAAPTVDVCFFGGLENDKKGILWSSWGDGCFASNGKYYASIGDHLGIDARSYIYEYDPMTRALRRVVDVLQTIAHMLGLYGHGKIHSGIHEGADGWLYFSTYWGKHREIEAAFAKGYKGSLLLRYNPKTGETQNLGAIVPRQGLPASAFDARRGLLFFHAVYEGDITVYDIKAQKVKFQGGGDRSTASRTFMRASDGRVFFSGTGDTLHYYDPASNQLKPTKVHLPVSSGKKGNTLRAAAAPTSKGILYGMTASGQLFAFDPQAMKVKDLGPNFLTGSYTAVMVLSPDEKYLYYAPGAHGSGNSIGAPVVQYEIASGRRKVLAFLKEPLQERFDYKIGGTYNLQIDPAGERLFFTFNGAPTSGRGTFGKPAVVVVHVPASERRAEQAK